ncbi:AAA family ATPase [Ectothiorhodospira variabilis]|uniref:AAA family ATPase n=1 Tax=Ectothiorhodospira variabilis TaxID=505694 RepID=UPI001EFB4E56|nr:AAA family ATPase [Ectothiorhodospira variabilis]MCG5495639.1 AAA family ATPase [Ectothiorhodospira variabilis]MCG5504700.1 AAA family ATPase [Ectothiorhodospira variabilis]MCG5507857.1 AAA family ATPase [Ectothiorhodospira variabilis]
MGSEKNPLDLAAEYIANARAGRRPPRHGDDHVVRMPTAGREAPQPEQEDERQRPVKLIGLSDFLAQKFPPRDNLLAPWLPSQGLCMVFAQRGIGKTHFALGVAYAVASGGAFLGWEAPEPKGVLYLDGEMPAGAMQERLAAIVASAEHEAAAPFDILTPDLQPEGMPRLDSAQGQDAIESILTPEHKLIVVDNISTLTATRENEADGWSTTQAWALRQRSAGRSVLFIHHAGKGGAQRGTSRREDVLDTSIRLSRPQDYDPRQGACFEIHFEKARGILGEDVASLEATLAAGPDGSQTWVTRTVEESTFDRVVDLLREGLSQKEVALELEINKSNVNRHAKRAVAGGYLTDEQAGTRSKK